MLTALAGNLKGKTAVCLFLTEDVFELENVLHRDNATLSLFSAQYCRRFHPRIFKILNFFHLLFLFCM